MATAPNALSQSSLVSNVVDDLNQLSQSNQTGNSSSCADPNGPYAKLIADLVKLIQSLQSQNSKWQPGTEMPPNGSPSQPTPYSTNSIPANVQQDPMSHFSQEQLQRGQSMASHLPQIMPNAIRTDNGANTGTGFHPTVSAANFRAPYTDLRTNAGVTDHRVGAGVPPSSQPPVSPTITTRDHRTGSQDPTTTATINTRDHRTTSATVIPDSGFTETVDPTTGAIVRDHMHPISSGDGASNISWATPPTQQPIAVSSPLPPPAMVPPSSVGGTEFTSGADYASLGQANSDLESAKQAALDDPTNPAKQLAFQEAAQKLQLTFNVLQQLSSMKASMADAAIKNIKVNAA